MKPQKRIVNAYLHIKHQGKTYDLTSLPGVTTGAAVLVKPCGDGVFAKLEESRETAKFFIPF